MNKRFSFIFVFILSIFFLYGCSSPSTDPTAPPEENLPNGTPEVTSDTTISSENETCLGNMPVYTNAQPEPNMQDDLQDAVRTMESLSQASGGEVSVYITGDFVSDVIQFYQQNPPRDGYEKTLDLTSAEEGGIIVWEKGEMSAQMFTSVEEQGTVILLGCGPKLGSSSSPSLPLYTSEDGLADDTVTNIAFSSDGTAWVATTGGLSLFDGQSWTTFNKDNDLPGNWIADLAVSENDDVWVTVSALSYQGLARFDGASWQTFDYLNKADSIAIATDGAVWVGVCDMHDGGVYRFDGQETTYYDESVILNVCVEDVFTTKDGTLWVAAKTSVAKFDGGNWEVFTGEDGLVGEARTIFVDQNGLVWVGTDTGVSRFDGQTWTTYSQEDGLAGKEVNAITEAPDGSLWFGTSGGVSHLQGSSWQTYTEDDGLPNNMVSSISIAPDGRIWIGTTFDGVAILEPEE